MNTSETAALQHLSHAELTCARVPGLDAAAAPRKIRSVGVVGAGTMGAGIALACISRGFEVVLLDNSNESLQRGLGTIGKLLESGVRKQRITPAEATAARARLVASDDYDSLAHSDLVIEAVFESMAVKEAVFSDLDRVCRPGAILATNTSTLDVDRIAAATGRPEDVVGLHFFSPAHVMRLLEIVRGAATGDAVIAGSLEFARTLGKIGVVVGNCFGFVGNRMLYGYGRENQFLLLEGAAPEYVDEVLTRFGMAMGPNAVGDLAGLDVGYNVRRERTDLPDDPRYYRVADLLAEQGRYGQKTGAGIYAYKSGSRTPLPDPAVQAMIEAEAARLGIERRDIDAQEIVERCIYALVVEGARLLEEKIALRPGDIDVVWANGYGFPRQRGGPMFYADTVGPARIYERIRQFNDRFGSRYWEPPALLQSLAGSGRRFCDLEE
ncbi:MAG: hypothetical protein HKN81_09235 [Gammaproteobacteria bacterium]|nr:hypothetical protein [Gammaproteobacteria bacterium]